MGNQLRIIQLYAVWRIISSQEAAVHKEFAKQKKPHCLQEQTGWQWGILQGGARNEHENAAKNAVKTPLEVDGFYLYKTKKPSITGLFCLSTLYQY
ncbi:hypothetical protein [Geosporobacter ferrireducens]|uniref:Uncharacterized protein n=1 Tax=Geosporobacter ferrireducens TaxID=1424294 RepID=A0A1D8GNH1_9FIRM|nr:hypothetical protein [Geosporobacter ferrireducens]AOT72434.1 hypothetical protein Gferi_24510 [Geosporobacter ferrireducens]